MNRRRRPGTCGRKRRFPDEYEAERKLKRAQDKAERDGSRTMPVRCYYHGECGGFHITSRPYE